MATLVAGVQYSLTSQGHLNDNKSLIFVKLTDSAIRAIEEYVRNKNKSGQYPTIQFQGNEGHLRLPTLNQSNSGTVSSRASNGTGPSNKQFKFSLTSSCDSGQQGSFECIKYTTGQRCVERVGPMPCIMRVQANEDVYEKTKSRMAAVDRKHKENCTREIELDKGGMGIGKRVKVRPKPLDSGPLKRKEPPNQQNITTTPYSTPPKSHTRPQGNNHAQKPGNPEISKKNIRDRVIHLLAVRPYKKPELFLALNKDGLRDKERSGLNNTLLSVATSKDNTFHLLRHIWSDVQDDWPFYSDIDKKMVKKRRPQNLTPPGSSDGGSPESPGSQSPVGSNKRPGYYETRDGLPTKKPRISHYQQPIPQVAAVGRTSSGTAGLLPTPTTTPTHAPPSPQPAAVPAVKLPHPSPPTPPQDKTPPKPDYPPNNQPSKPVHEYPKYLLDYTTIKDSDQRRKYKEDFNANYNEYKKLHAMVEKVTKRFSQLDEKLRREEKGSPSWQRIKEQILQEYHESNKNPRHQEAKKRFLYLHEKLSHIKRLVMDYDAKVT